MNRDDMPLLCTICERKPSFSDISHLLTHISSKQHLSNYFRIQVQSNGDDAAQATLDQYNAWYEEWNMSELLKDRMDQKEKKKNSTSQRATNVYESSRRTAKVAKPKPAGRAQSNSTYSEGRKPAPQIKVESGVRPFAAAPSHAFETGYSAHSAATSSLYAWPNHTTFFKTEDDSDSEADAAGEDEVGLADFVQPTRWSRRKNSRLVNGANAQFSSSCQDSDGFEDLPEEELKESVKLKGVVWPGMLLFDSATPEMQRRRNQKKTTDVVAQLEATSKIVEPDELIFSRSGEFLKQREISGNAEPDTPLKGETTPEADTPPVKKRKARTRRTRVPLADRDENSSVLTRRSQRSHTTFGNNNNYSNKRKAAVHETSDDIDNAITYQSSRKKRREGLSIHRDNSGPDITFDHVGVMHHDFGSPYMLSGMENAPPHSRLATLRVDGSMGPPATYSFMPDQDYYRPGLAFSQFRPASSGSSTAQDLSTFGHLTPAFQPSHNPFSNVESVRYRPAVFHGQQAPISATAGAHAYSNSMQQPSIYSGTAPSGLQHGHHSFDDLSHQIASAGEFTIYDDLSSFARNDSANPLFFGSDQVFPEDTELLATVQLKREPDRLSDADTVSLPSDQK